MTKIEKTNELTRPELAEVRRPYEISAAIAAPTFLAGDTWAAEAYPCRIRAAAVPFETIVTVYAPDSLACDDVLLAYVLPALFGDRAADVHICAADGGTSDAGTDPRAAGSTSWSRLLEYLKRYDCADDYTVAYRLDGGAIAVDGLKGWNAILQADAAIAVVEPAGYYSEFAWYVFDDSVEAPEDSEPRPVSDLLPDNLQRLDDFDAIPAPVVRALRLYAEGNDGRSDRYTGGNDLLNASEALRLAAEN